MTPLHINFAQLTALAVNLKLTIGTVRKVHQNASFITIICEKLGQWQLDLTNTLVLIL